MSIIGCTSDCFGGWDGLEGGEPDKLITEDTRGGRLPEVIRRGEPAIMYVHWPGFYGNGKETGFRVFQLAVARLRAGYDNLIWMKLSEIARYWAARELTRIDRDEGSIAFRAPFACPRFTVRFTPAAFRPPRLNAGNGPAPLVEVNRPLDLKSGTWTRKAGNIIACLDLSGYFYFT